MSIQDDDIVTVRLRYDDAAKLAALVELYLRDMDIETTERIHAAFDEAILRHG